MAKSTIKDFFEKYKYPLIMLAVASLLLLVPSKEEDIGVSPREDIQLQDILSSSQGVGRAMMVISENGVVISCDGAGDAKVRLDILRAVGSYTGFGSDKITILKMEK